MSSDPLHFVAVDRFCFLISVRIIDGTRFISGAQISSRTVSSICILDRRPQWRDYLITSIQHSAKIASLCTRHFSQIANASDVDKI